MSWLAVSVVLVPSRATLKSLLRGSDYRDSCGILMMAGDSAILTWDIDDTMEVGKLDLSVSRTT